MKNKLVYFECEIDNHECNLLNQVCIDTQCKQRGLLCLFCQYHHHKGHEVRPLKIFLNEYQANYKKFEESEQSSIEKDFKTTIESYESIHECISVFQQIIHEQIEKLKEDLQIQITQKKKLIEDNYIQEDSSQFQKALSTIIDNECVSAEDQIKCIQILLSRVNSSNMAIEFKGRKQIQNTKESKLKIQEIETSKNKIAVSMSRITDELTIITKQISDLVYDNSKMQQNEKSLDKIIKPISPARPIEQTRSVLKPVPQKIQNNKKQMEKMFKGIAATDDQKMKQEVQTQSNMDDLFSSQWNVQDQEKKQFNDINTNSINNYLEINQKDSEYKNNVRSSYNNHYDDHSDSNLSFERYQGKANGKKKQTAKQKKEIRKQNEMINEDEPKVMKKSNQKGSVQKQLEGQIQKVEEQNQFYDCSQAKQQTFSSSFTQQEINLDVKVDVKFKSHEGIAKDVIFLDEQRLATCSYDRQIKVWDIVQKKLLCTLKGHDGRIMQIKYSKKHNLIGSAGKDKLGILWKDYSYQLAHKLVGHKESVMSIEFIDSRDLVVTGGSDQKINIWCIHSGKLLQNEDNAVDSIFQIKYDGTNQLLFVGGYQHIVIYAFLEVKSSELKKNDDDSLKLKSEVKQITSFKAHEDNINMIQPINIKGNQYFMTCSDDKTLKLWDFDKLQVIQSIKEDTEISAFCFFERLGVLVISMWGYLGGGRTSFYDFSDFTKIQDIESINTGTTSIKMNELQNKLVSSHENGEIQLYYMNY